MGGYPGVLRACAPPIAGAAGVTAVVAEVAQPRTRKAAAERALRCADAWRHSLSARSSVFRRLRGRRLKAFRASSLAVAPRTDAVGEVRPIGAPLGVGALPPQGSALAVGQTLLVRIGLEQIQADLVLARAGTADAVHLPLDLFLEEDQAVEHLLRPRRAPGDVHVHREDAV